MTLNGSDRNMFEPCDSVDNLMAQVVGAASVCWKMDSPPDGRVFDDVQASRIVNDALAMLKALRPMPAEWDELEETIVNIMDDAPMSQQVSETTEEILSAVRHYLGLRHARHREQARATLELARRATRLAADLAEVLERVSEMAGWTRPEPSHVVHAPELTQYSSGSM